ncbi:MAG: tRNA-(ms[2]io[6]A)-hydroxylase [Gammaproteobacteria bacterium]|nr:tRNA-(ms[2]io[6]A)-hydroxylase [Gammaproteobacteria bacterium]
MNVNKFLYCPTPDAWLEAALENIPVLLIDHANCEKKAASTALNLMFRYVDKTKVLLQLSKLAREELRHFEQVVTLLKARGMDYEHISSSRYVGELRKGVRTFEPARLIDTLIVSAVVEARSCERFTRLVPLLDAELSRFYADLVRSEERHFRVYLDLAEMLSGEVPIEERVGFFLERDKSLVEGRDSVFRFHSGVPVVLN